MNSRDNRIYDLRGLKCPLPVLKTEKRLRGMPSGALLTVDTSDPLAIIDIPHFCTENGHTLVAREKTESGHRFAIRKG
ncbi:sulfurtransferase TusA family protein [Rhizobium calliandrae]|uniref:Sulfurtransferase TusA family protein n=1 Tax=Rhizobium calliandrae TaxID=1312182 RepID=A0ABT7KCI9_9HYPH|nr:sulfurtransferase TusA family protein [Rhizobium calliandrae]MDL2406350.1 sulfurtransferase TusA family protein [Rhizobium calliandrae]